jgi:hypothetical protein
MMLTLSILALLGCRETMRPDIAVPTSDPTDDWAALLADVVTHDGYVDYQLLEKNREPLDRYVAWLGRYDVWGDPDEVKITADHHAFYLNAFNALVMYQVLERDRPASILDVDGWYPADGSKFWVTTDFQVGRDKLSLAELMHERIRWGELDFRDHSAMNYAARSNPPMRRELYGNGELASQLRHQMRKWLGDPDRGVRIVDGTAHFNPIFKWYARDFTFFSAGLEPCELGARYAPDPLAEQLAELDAQGCPHTFFEFDWALNDSR